MTPSGSAAHADSERPTVVAASGVTHVAAPAEELPVSSERMLPSVMTADADEHLALDAEEPGRACALSGRVLEPGALCDIVSFVAQAVWRGELVVASDDGIRSLFFDEGHVVAAESSASSERLGEVLCRSGILTRDQVSAATELAAVEGRRFGEAAVSLGFMSREALFDSMALQIEQIFVAVLRVEQGSFVFFHGYEEARLSYRKKHEVEALVAKAIAAIDDVRWFRSRIPSDHHVPVRTARAEPQVDPLGVYAAIDGARSLSELAKSVESTPLEVTRALFQHVHTGHASVRAPRLAAIDVLNIYNKAILVLLRELDAMDEGDAVRAELAAFAERRGERPEFADAPAEDGTLDAETIVARIAALDDPTGESERLARWLYDYASYALFLARPHLHRRDLGRAQPRVSQRVAEMLEALAPSGEVVLPPAQGMLRVTVPAPSSPSVSGTHERANTIPAGPQSIASTVRMRRVLPEALPGVDPSRTVRMSPFSFAPRVGPASRSPLVQTTGVASSIDPAPVVSSAAPAARARRRWPLLAVALLGAASLGWLGHRVASPAPGAIAAPRSSTPPGR